MAERDPEELLTPTDAAHVLNLSADTVRALCDRGELPALRTMGGRRLFRRVDVERLASRRQQAHALRPGPAGRGSHS